MGEMMNCWGVVVDKAGNKAEIFRLKAFKVAPFSIFTSHDDEVPVVVGQTWHKDGQAAHEVILKR